MTHYLKLISVLSAGTLLGCTQLSTAPPLAQPLAAPGADAAVLPRIQAVQRVTSPLSEVDGLFATGQSAYGAGQLALAEAHFGQVLALQPLHFGALNALALIYAQTERADQALAFFKRAQETVWRDRPKEQAAPAPATAGPHLVAVANNVYELRDGPTGSPAAGPSLAATGNATPSLAGVRIEVSNGVGIRHLARRTAERLAPNGVVTARLTNQPSYQQPRTEIQFGAGQEQAASALSTLFPVAVKTVQSRNLTKNIQMRLVLGHDLAGRAVAAWLEPEAPTLKQQVSVSHAGIPAAGTS